MVNDKQLINATLLLAGTGYAVNRYQAYKLRTSEKGYLETNEQQMKMLGAGIAILGTASAGIIHFTKDKPRARKIAFGTLALGTIGYFVLIAMAVRKMSFQGNKKEKK